MGIGAIMIDPRFSFFGFGILLATFPCFEGPCASSSAALGEAVDSFSSSLIFAGEELAACPHALAHSAMKSVGTSTALVGSMSSNALVMAKT
jgi:hypothetical protein